jgi:hypothetical protein
MKKFTGHGKQMGAAEVENFPLAQDEQLAFPSPFEKVPGLQGEL